MKSWKGFIVAFLISGIATGGMLTASAESLTSEKLWSALPHVSLSAKSSQSTNSSESTNNSQTNSNSYQNARLVSLNSDLMRTQLSLKDSDVFAESIQARGVNNVFTNHINIPLPDGSNIDLSLIEDSVLPKNLAAKFPDIKTYRVLANDRVFSGKVDMSKSGFHAMLQMKNGEIVFIDPVLLNKNEYAVFHKRDQLTTSDRKHSCGVDSFSDFSMGNQLSNKLLKNQLASIAARPQENLINYTIAVATTGEYSAKFGGSVDATMAAITTTINRVNQVLERDLGIHLNLAENNDLLINTNADSDPFTNNQLLDLVFQNQDFIDSVIGNVNYDIGHLFTTSGGGLAAVASVCNNGSKAKGASGITSPSGDSFDLDFVAHEIGHQLGATHTFNSAQGACNEDTRTASTAFEPGSGSTIMSYAGYCGLDNIQSNADAMYHIGSIKQIEQYTKFGEGSHCGVLKTSENTPPVVDAGRDYTIPARTPFELVGDAVDSDGDSLLYTWEQLDAGEASIESADKGNNALFRVHKPSSSKQRSFPPLENVLNHTSAKGESLPIYQRELTMSFVALDSFNVAQSDEMTVNVARTGSRFALNYPRAEYTRAETYSVYWNVANTDQAPVNCSSVNLWLSVDGGNHFNYSVAKNVPNNGETLVTIPADLPITAQGRFKIKCSDNIFYAVSHRDFHITQYDNSVTIQYNNEDQPEENLNDRSLDSEPVVSTSDVTSSVSNSGGGHFELLKVLFLFLLVKGLIRFSYRKK